MRTIPIDGHRPKPLGAPDDWNPEQHGHCTALFVRDNTVSGVNYMQSAWEADDNEVLAQLAGARIVLGIQGRVHPVVNLSVGEMHIEFEPVMTARRFTTPEGFPAVRVEMLFPHPTQQQMRVYCEMRIDGTLADAISMAVTQIENLTRESGSTV